RFRGHSTPGPASGQRVRPALMTRHQSSSSGQSKGRRIAHRSSAIILEYLIALPIGCLAALLWVNTLPESYFRFAHAFAFSVNDVGMAFFFALITKEVTEATLPGG